MEGKKIFFPILFKLMLLMTALLGGIGLITAWQNARLFKEISVDREKSANLAQVKSRSSEVESLIGGHVEKVKFFGLDLLGQVLSGKGHHKTFKSRFRFDQDLVSLTVKSIKLDKIETLQTLVNEEVFAQYGVTKDYLKTIDKKFNFVEDNVFQGKLLVINVTDKIPLLKLGIPLLAAEQGHYTHIAIAYVRLDRIQKIFSMAAADEERLIYLVDKLGKIVAHPDENLVLMSKDLSNIPIVKDSIKSKVNIKQKFFINPQDKRRYFASYSRTSFGLTVIGQVPESLINAPAKIVKGQSYYLLGVILSISFFLIFVFSTTITTPIEKLLGFTREISKGNFDIQASKAIRSRDEVGSLANAFDRMGRGLRERDKIKNMFNKFHGQSITEELLNTTLDLKGDSRDVTVFFSDIRSFTKFSEKHSAEEVVEMLNDYFEIMVSIIVKYGGVVDKFIGDAIMAVWGVPKQGMDDMHRGVMACIEMRGALAVFNEKRLAEGKEPILIGMGLHSGKVISGTVGSKERMEYTVIGDTVNTAARIEAATKTYGTDLLISGGTAKKIENNFIIKYAGESFVKGKDDSLKLYKVDGIIDENNQPVIVQTPYSSYKAEKDVKVKAV